ncbi:5'-methylthioadenosine/adenosylhomocysteine nucleosidase [Flavobacterium album]|uniref:5'-methylthioadenosine/adenosylhomocysteine nucleosidase n=1 Tax=Flavobacterium album TaxID=2175091 RepID=A0A2S1QZZ3_9FLAO|nr:5'-methylthioadenosine/adenosylhomocysteine nucleosidase [Flavobacterium album]AWH85924.1 5'-methylthioadenosine/adenosylhomocysteine nucleosidase [Flavobacterium album]
MSERIIGIMGAMPEEIDGVISLLENPQRAIIGMRSYTSGTINGIRTVVVFSRWGKVAASATAATLIHIYKITELIFTGVAGAIDPTLKIGDIIIAKKLIQHDLDARPLMSRFEIPLLGLTHLECGEGQLDRARHAVTPLITNGILHDTIGKNVLDEFGINTPNLHIGDIASGDQFFSSDLQKQELNEALPTVLCVEMEGAAVAQVCYEHKIPFTVIRTISDTADEKSHVDFPKFIQKVSSQYSVLVIEHLLANHSGIC